MSGTFGKRLRRIREMRKLSQSDLAARCGLMPSAISHFETGNREPSLRNFVRLYQALRVNPAILLAATTGELTIYEILQDEDIEFIDLVRSTVIARHRKRIKERKAIERRHER